VIERKRSNFILGKRSEAKSRKAGTRFAPYLWRGGSYGEKTQHEAWKGD